MERWGAVWVHLSAARPRRSLAGTGPTVEQAGAAQPRVKARVGRACLLTANREPCADACASARLRVIVGGRAVSTPRARS
jgi:hypothetical protein